MVGYATVAFLLDLLVARRVLCGATCSGERNPSAGQPPVLHSIVGFNRPAVERFVRIMTGHFELVRGRT